MTFPTRRRTIAVTLGAALCATAPVHAEPAKCSELKAPIPAETWLSSCKHSLCGFVVAARTTSPLDPNVCSAETWAPMLEAVRSTLAKGGIVALGEVHDNETHHQTRAQLLSGAKSVVFEQIRTDKSARLSELYASKSAITSEAVISAVEWSKSGWPVEDYKPIIDSVVSNSARIYAGDATKAIMIAIATGQGAPLKDDERGRLALDKPLGDALDQASLAEIEEAHCGMMPKEAVGGMAAAQRYRDASLADATLTAIREHGSSVLIAGNGHVRTDRGVPWYIAQRSPQTPVLSIVFVETEDGRTDPKDYGPRDVDGKLAADFIVFTPSPAKSRGDPCDKFKAKKKTG